MTENILVRDFVKNAELASATVELIPGNPEALTRALEAQTAGDESVLLAEPSDLDDILFSRYRKSKKIITEPDTQQLREIPTGVTDAFCGVASTGSVCVSVGPRLNAVIGMLTRKHIVVLEATSIIPRPKDVLSKGYLGGKGLLRSFSYITGPSATADMGPLVRGVHGPGRLHIIVLE